MTKIMLVEDDKSLREIYGIRLLAEGYEIKSAGDGEEALAMAVKEHPDLIISDVMMPKISGFDMLDILRSTPETKDVKVIMMTALSSEDQRTRGESLGANRYLVKSQVGIEDVVRAVHEVLADSPITAASATQTFNSPTSSAISNNQPKTTPLPQSQPVSAPAQPPVSTPIQNPATPLQDVIRPLPVQATTPTSMPISEPIQNPIVPPQDIVRPTPVQTAPPTVAPVASIQLPQPTAPFSSPAPASLGDRIINPVQSNPPTPDIATLMNQELNGTPSMPQNPGQPNPPQV